MGIRSCMAQILVYTFLAAHHVWAVEQVTAEAPYSYYYKGSLITLNASSNLVAVDEGASQFAAAAAAYNLARDPLSDRYPAKSRSIGIYRISQGKGQKGAAPPWTGAVARTLSVTTGAVAQPVFEQGRSVLIPSDEVIVGFKERITLTEALDYLAPHFETLLIVGAREHREKIFIIRIGNPSDGRVFQVARSLSLLPKVSFAEPNFIKVTRAESESENLLRKSIPRENFVAGLTGTGDRGPTLSVPGAPDWTVLANLNFESAELPSGWQAGTQEGSSNVYWGVTTFRKHGGSRSLYCAASGELQVSPPGPVPLNMGALLLSPTLDLSPYEEVYVEFWFYAINETAITGTSYDYPSVYVIDAATGQGFGAMLVTSYQGNLTLDPTTSNGWRRMLFRVPPSVRHANVFVALLYESDNSIQTEGAYIDDVRIVGALDVDNGQLSNDTYSSRQYELKNTGQVAGLVVDRNDLHLPEAWQIATVSPDLVVAVIDEGVELAHPDLNLVTGYDFDGQMGGQPRGTPRGSHGTNCAGNLGAIKDNGIGVVGTAPGVKIMPVYWGESWADNSSAIDVAVARGARILSNSWGSVTAPSADIEGAVTAALAAGRVVLFAAGNGPDRPPYSYQVAFPGVLAETTDAICVGASSPTDEHKGAASSDGQFGWGSSYVGEGPDVTAPGPWSYSTDLLGAEGANDGSLINPADSSTADYHPSFGGTSSSTPKVAGIVALMLSRNPNLTPAQVKSILRSTADDIGEPGIDDRTGAGRVNALRALQAVPAANSVPQVISTMPAEGAVAVPLNSVVAATFSAALDAGTVNAAVFTLDNGVTGEVAYHADGNRVTFTPSLNLAVNTTYTATITEGVKDVVGTPLAAAKRWSFTTGSALAPDGDLNGDGAVSALDALRALRMAVGLESGEAPALGHGDMNRDGVISSVDALLILRKAVGL